MPHLPILALVAASSSFKLSGAQDGEAHAVNLDLNALATLPQKHCPSQLLADHRDRPRSFGMPSQDLARRPLGRNNDPTELVLRIKTPSQP